MDFDGINLIISVRLAGEDEESAAVLTPHKMIEMIAFMKDRGIYLNEQKKRFIQAPGTWPDNSIFIPKEKPCQEDCKSFGEAMIRVATKDDNPNTPLGEQLEGE